MGWSRLPLENGKDDDEKHQRIYRYGKRRSKDRQQKTAKSGAHNSGKVQLNPAQCYRRGKLLFVDDVRNNRAQNWRAESQPNAEREDAAEHCARVDRSRPRAKGKKRGAGSLPQQGNHDQSAPANDVRDGSRWQRKEKEWRGSRRCHERQRKRRGAKIVHQPCRRHVLCGKERPGQDARQPYTAKDRVS